MEEVPSIGGMTLCDVLDRTLTNGVVAQGDVVISLANVDLIRIHLSALLSAVDTLAEAAEEGTSKSVGEVPE